MQPNKATIKRETAVAQAAPSLRLYAVKNSSCPQRLIEAWSAEEAKARYRDWYNLHASREIEAAEVENANAV